MHIQTHTHRHAKYTFSQEHKMWGCTAKIIIIGRNISDIKGFLQYKKVQLYLSGELYDENR